MSIENIINEAWENKDQVSQNSDKSLKDAVNQIIDDLDSGKARVAEKINGEWVTHPVSYTHLTLPTICSV